MNYTLTNFSHRFLAETKTPENKDQKSKTQKGRLGNEDPFISLFNMIVSKAIFDYLRDFHTLLFFVTCSRIAIDSLRSIH